MLINCLGGLQIMKLEKGLLGAPKKGLGLGGEDG